MVYQIIWETSQELLWAQSIEDAMGKVHKVCRVAFITLFFNHINLKFSAILFHPLCQAYRADVRPTHPQSSICR